MATVVKIDGTDVTAHVALRSVSYSHDIEAREFRGSFLLLSTSPVTPKNDSVVEITKTDGATRASSGLVRIPVTTHVPAGERIDRKVEYVGWTTVLRDLRIDTNWEFASGNNDRFNVKALLDFYYGQIGTGLTHRLRSRRADMPLIVFPAGQLSLYDAFQAMAAEAWGALWWVDADKVFHWNDIDLAAPFALSAVANGSLVKAAMRLDRVEDNAHAPYRVRVNGNTYTAVYTATDFVAMAKAEKRRQSEFSAPSERVRQLPDFNDPDAGTAAAAKQRAFIELAKVAPRLSYRVPTMEEGLLVGQRIDLIDETVGTGIAQHATFRRRWRVPSTTPGIHKGLGRFQVRRIHTKHVNKDRWRYDVEVGDVEPVGGGAVAR